jgi:hypothetical protein
MILSKILFLERMAKPFQINRVSHSHSSQAESEINCSRESLLLLTGVPKYNLENDS